MSRTNPTEVERRMLTFFCHQCSREAGMWCITKSGKPADLHGNRFDQATKAGLLPVIA